MSEESNMAEWEAEKLNIKNIVNKAVADIKEHCDSVQIIVTRHGAEAERDMSYEKGSGPIYSRLGAVGEWLEIQKQYVRNWAIREDNKEDE